MSQDTLVSFGQARVSVRKKYSSMWTLGARRTAMAVGALVLGLTLDSCAGAGSVPGGGSHGTGPTAQPVSKLDNWVMYGHDGKHTSASDASITGGLKQAWRYNPVPLSGNTFGGMFSVVGTTAGVYMHYSQYGPTVFAGGPSVDAVSPTGELVWSYVEHRDYDEGHWLSVIGTGVVLQDDGMPLLDISKGTQVKWLASSFDSWGETIPDSTGLYGTNTFLADGADLYVYAYSTSNALLWKALQQKSTKYSDDNNGGLLLSNGTLFYAASYSDPSPNPSGIYALNAESGAKIGYVATTPTSEMSGDAKNIYLIENSSTLVARSQSTLAKVWSVSLSGSGTAAPVIADGMVIVGTFNGVEAHDPGSGKTIWTSSVQPEYGGQYSSAMAAALVSNTLVVTSYNGVHLLNIANGSDMWHGGPTGASNPIIVNDPAVGATVYVIDGTGVIALVPTSSAR
jgi:hypothetical protein